MRGVRWAGAILGAWFVANVAAYRLLVRSGWPSGGDAPADLRVDLFDLLPPWAGVAIFVAAFVIPAVLVPIWRYVERSTGIDQTAVASASRWCLRALSRPASAGVIALTVALFVLPAIDGELWFSALPAIAFLVLLPFGVFTPVVAASPAGEGWWRPRWPGLRPCLSVLLLLAIVLGLQSGLYALAESLPSLALLAGIVEVAVGVLAVALEGAILLFAIRPGEAVQRIGYFLSWPRLGPVIAVHARLLYLVSFLFPPVLVGALLLWKVIPFHAAWAESRGAVLPWSARALTLLGAALETSGALVAAFLFGLALLLVVSRVLWLTTTPGPLRQAS